MIRFTPSPSLRDKVIRLARIVLNNSHHGASIFRYEFMRKLFAQHRIYVQLLPHKHATPKIRKSTLEVRQSYMRIGNFGNLAILQLQECSCMTPDLCHLQEGKPFSTKRKQVSVFFFGLLSFWYFLELF